MSTPRVLPSRDASRFAPAEWRPGLLLVAVYGTWLLAALAWRRLGPGIPASCWFMSLQHALIHGHPTRSGRINRALGLAPLAVWYP